MDDLLPQNLPAVTMIQLTAKRLAILVTAKRSAFAKKLLSAARP
jgi:hypothetical protein